MSPRPSARRLEAERSAAKLRQAQARQRLKAQGVNPDEEFWGTISEGSEEPSPADSQPAP